MIANKYLKRSLVVSHVCLRQNKTEYRRTFNWVNTADNLQEVVKTQGSLLVVKAGRDGIQSFLAEIDTWREMGNQIHR